MRRPLRSQRKTPGCRAEPPTGDDAGSAQEEASGTKPDARAIRGEALEGRTPREDPAVRPGPPRAPSREQGLGGDLPPRWIAERATPGRQRAGRPVPTCDGEKTLKGDARRGGRGYPARQVEPPCAALARVETRVCRKTHASGTTDDGPSSTRTTQPRGRTHADGVENLTRAIAGVAPREDVDDADSQDGQKARDHVA
jgi:hypothetical protein